MRLQRRRRQQRSWRCGVASQPTLLILTLTLTPTLTLALPLPLPLTLPQVLRSIAADTVSTVDWQEARAYISPISPLYLPYISPISLLARGARRTASPS